MSIRGFKIVFVRRRMLAKGGATLQLSVHGRVYERVTFCASLVGGGEFDSFMSHCVRIGDSFFV